MTLLFYTCLAIIQEKKSNMHIHTRTTRKAKTEFVCATSTQNILRIWMYKEYF